MVHIEEGGRKRKHKRDLKYVVLSVVKASTLLGIMLVAPNVPGALHKLGLLPREENTGSMVGRARRLLIKQGLLEERRGHLRLTTRGKSALTILEAKYAGDVRRRWDGRWRVLIFDVPEYRKTIRDKIRRTLMHVGFVRLQDSVWVYPYDCEDLITLLKADFKIGKDVLYMIVDEMEGDASLRRQFGLKTS